jgi:4,5-dihydroxyphthalate decarboxylase
VSIVLTLNAAIGRYPNTAALLSGEITDPGLRFSFADVAPVNRAFAPMVREGRYDLSEMAIATFLQARAFNKDLVLLPVVLAARSQEASLLCRTDSDIAGAADLVGRRVGVRAYSQTTGMWLRGLLHDQHGVTPDQIHWVTVEGAHVAEYRDPSFVERAGAGQDLTAMLRSGALDAIIVGNDAPSEAAFRTVFPDPAAAGAAFHRAHGFVPVNHLVVVRRPILDDHPGLAARLVALFAQAKAAAGLPREKADTLTIGRAALGPAITLALRYAEEQGLLPHGLRMEDVWKGLPEGIE